MACHNIIVSTTCTQIPHHIHWNHHACRSSRRKSCLPIPPCLRSDSDYATLAQDISAAEQASLKRLRVPELSPSDPISNASSPSSSEPVTPVDLPSLAARVDPLVAGKHQPDPQPYKPVSKTTSRGAVWRARQVLLSLGKRKRQPSEDAGIRVNVDVQVLDSEEEEGNIESPAETTPPASQVSHTSLQTSHSFAREMPTAQSLFTLPNVPIDGMAPTPVRPRVRVHPLIWQSATFSHAY